MNISMENSYVDVQPLPGGQQGKMIVVADKAGNVVLIPLPTEACREIAMKLTTSLMIATGPLSTKVLA